MFEHRAYMLDISRDRVPTMKTLREIVDLLARCRYNQFQLYTEHTFAYSRHQVVWEDADPMTAAEIRKLDAYCRMQGIELVANQNSFGHMERWLTHAEYNHLAKFPKGGAMTPWGTVKKFPTTLNKGQPVFVSEYGGIGWKIGHTPGDAWGYGNNPTTEEEFIARFKGLADACLDTKGIMGLCYTQLTDVEQEINGLYTYERVPKFPAEVICPILSRKAWNED